MLSRLGPLAPNATVFDVGCSTGYLLEDLRTLLPSGRLVGFDLIYSGLKKASANIPNALILQADACHLPTPDCSADVLVSANLLEHVADDSEALAEFWRVLRPGSRAVIVVPLSPGTYDYYDRYLNHQRRYRHGELAEKARNVGFTVIEDTFLCSIIYPAFWLVKKRNRLRCDHLTGPALKERVSRDIAGTQDSPIFSVACNLERWLRRHGIALPFGIRGLSVLERPSEGT